MGQFPHYVTESETVDDVTELIVDTGHSDFVDWDDLAAHLPPGREFKLVPLSSILGMMRSRLRELEIAQSGEVYKPKSASPKRPRIAAGSECECGSGVSYRNCCRAKKLRRRLKK